MILSGISVTLGNESVGFPVSLPLEQLTKRSLCKLGPIAVYSLQYQFTLDARRAGHDDDSSDSQIRTRNVGLRIV